MPSSTTAARRARTRRPAGMPSPWGMFIRGFIKHPVMVGSVMPSSQKLIDKMLSKTDWANTKLFVEYGPGVGTFCPTILEHMAEDAHYIAIDTNPDFIRYLRHTITDKRFFAVHGSAADVRQIIADHGHDHADYMLSGLPFSTLPEAVAIEEQIVEPIGQVVMMRNVLLRAPRHVDAIDPVFDRPDPAGDRAAVEEIIAPAIRRIGLGQADDVVNVALLDRHAAVHIAFAELERGVARDLAQDAPIVQADRDRGEIGARVRRAVGLGATLVVDKGHLAALDPARKEEVDQSHDRLVTHQIPAYQS